MAWITRSPPSGMNTSRLVSETSEARLWRWSKDCCHPRPIPRPTWSLQRVLCPARWWARLALALVLLVCPVQAAIALEAPAAPQALPARASYRCDGDPLQAHYEAGAVDDPAIPNSLAGTLPGAFVLLDWRGLHLQLPRTNNSGAPSYSDGRWWWRPLSADRPEFRQRRGALISYACEASAADPSPVQAPLAVQGATLAPGV